MNRIQFYKFLHWFCFISGCIGIVAAYSYHFYFNTLDNVDRELYWMVHSSAALRFLIANFCGWLISKYLIGVNKIYPFKADDKTLNKLVGFYLFVIAIGFIIGPEGRAMNW
jgi:hypothetical protein